MFESLAGRWRGAHASAAPSPGTESSPWRGRFEFALAAVVSVVALAFLALMVVGVVRWYSPAPLADSWDGSLNFYLLVQEGRTDMWLRPSNEHRLIFSRALFWIDHRFFGGLQVFLTVANSALAIGCAGVFAWSATRLLRSRGAAWLAGALVCICCFSWMQSRNLTWAYQSQFFAAYLFPLAAFTSLARAGAGSRRAAWFAAAIVFAALAATSMANGILAAPLLAGMALLDAPRRLGRMLVLACLAVLVPWLYLRGYVVRDSPPADLLSVLTFALEFLGAPLEHAFGDRRLAIAAGALLFIIGSLGAWTWARQPTPRDPWLLALLLFLLYVAISGAAAGLRRAGLGSESGAAVRYATAALTAWAASVLIVFRITRDRRGAAAVRCATAACVLGCLAPLQFDALDHRGPTLVRSQQLALLALNLGLDDPVSARLLYANDRFLSVVARAKEAPTGPFTLPELAQSRALLLQHVDAANLVRCDGAVDFRKPLTGSTPGMRVYGWAFDRIEQRTPPFLYLADTTGRIVGAAYTGASRNGAEQLVGRAGEPCAFDGYLALITDERLDLYRPSTEPRRTFPEVQAAERKTPPLTATPTASGRPR